MSEPNLENISYEWINSFQNPDLLYPNVPTRTFSEVIPTVSEFLKIFTDYGIPDIITDQDEKAIVYYLLLGEYANSHLKTLDETRFKIKLATTIYSYYPTFKCKDDIQKIIRELTDEQILQDGVMIDNLALNPDQAPPTSSDEALDHVSQQNYSIQKKSILNALNAKYASLHSNMVKSFLDKFKDLFMKVVSTYDYLYYVD